MAPASRPKWPSASLRQMLNLAGFVVEAFPAAAPALAAVGQDWPGLVVTDRRMPHMSGIDLFRALHLRDPELPVILITGHGDGVVLATQGEIGAAIDRLGIPRKTSYYKVNKRGIDLTSLKRGGG